MSNSRGDMTIGDKSVSVPGQNRNPDRSRKVQIIVDPGEGWRADCGIDTSRIMVTAEEVNLQYAAQKIPTVVKDYYFRQSLPSFPACLVLNRAQEEPPYPRCRFRGVTWRRILSCMNRQDRPDWYRKQNPQHSGYSWESWRLGNLCIQVLSCANYNFNDYSIFASLDKERMGFAKILSTKNLCIMALLLLYLYLDEAWATTYQDIYTSIDSVTQQDIARAKAIIIVRVQVINLLDKLVKAIVGKGKERLPANEILERDPIFDSDAFRSYLWDIIMEHVANNYRDIADNSNSTSPYVLVDEFTNNVPRDLPQAQEYYRSLQALLLAGTGQFAWAGTWHIERWEFIRQSARDRSIKPNYANPDLLQTAHREYLDDGTIEIIPWFQCRDAYASIEDLESTRMSDGCWHCEPPISDAEVLLHTQLILKKKDLVDMVLRENNYLPGTGAHSDERTASDAAFFQPRKSDPKPKSNRKNSTKDPPTYSDYTTLKNQLPVGSSSSSSQRPAAGTIPTPQVQKSPPRKQISKPIPKKDHYKELSDTSSFDFDEGLIPFDPTVYAESDLIELNRRTVALEAGEDVIRKRLDDVRSDNLEAKKLLVSIQKHLTANTKSYREMSEEVQAIQVGLNVQKLRSDHNSVNIQSVAEELKKVTEALKGVHEELSRVRAEVPEVRPDIRGGTNALESVQQQLIAANTEAIVPQGSGSATTTNTTTAIVSEHVHLVLKPGDKWRFV